MKYDKVSLSFGRTSASIIFFFGMSVKKIQQDMHYKYPQYRDILNAYLGWGLGVLNFLFARCV